MNMLLKRKDYVIRIQSDVLKCVGWDLFTVDILNSVSCGYGPDFRLDSAIVVISWLNPLPERCAASVGLATETHPPPLNFLRNCGQH